MSILIAYKRGDTVYMGTDTRVLINDFKFTKTCESNHKIQRMDSGIIVGITGDRIARQTIFAYPEIFTLDNKGKLTRKHIFKCIIPKLTEVLKAKNLLVEKEDAEPYMEVQMMIAHKGDLYEICQNFSIYKYETFQVLGDVADYGQFTMVTTKESDDVNQRIVKALDIVAKNSPLVGRPYLLVDTMGEKYQLVGGKI